MSDQTRLPVVDSLTETLRFAAMRFPTVIKVALLPSLLIYVPILWITVTSLSGLFEMLPEMVDVEGGPNRGDLSDEQAVALMEAMAPFFLAMIALLPLSLLYNAMVAVPISRTIVLDEKPGFFRIDGLVWRYFFGQILFFFIVVGLMLAVFGATAAGVAALEAADVPELASVVVGLAGTVLFFFLIIRLSLYMVEIAVTGRFAPGGAFRVTSGSVWRLIGAGLLFLLLLIAIGIAFEIVFYVFGAIALAANFNAMQVAAEAEDIDLMFNAIKGMVVSPVGGAFAALFILYTLFMTGLQMAFPAVLYRNLGGPKG